MAKISGILTDGAGQIINDCTIELYAKKTTGKVLEQTQAFTVASDGKYSMNVLPCEYEVSLIINGFPKKRLGIINVYSDSVDGTLNDYLINPEESDLTPEFLKQIFDARNEAIKSAIDSYTSAKKSADSANHANTSETNAKSSADAAKASADGAATSSQFASKSAITATDAASVATTSSDTAKIYADNANNLAKEANQSAINSANSAKSANTSEVNAKSSAVAAKESADNAKEWASTIDPQTIMRYCGDLDNIPPNHLGALAKGIYYQKHDAKALVELGYPIQEAGSLIILPTLTEGNQSCVQIYTLYKSGRQFIRNYRGSTEGGFWENWVEQITTNNISADIARALPATKSVVNGVPTYSVGNNISFEKAPTVNGKSVITDLTDVNNKINSINTNLNILNNRIYVIESYSNGNAWYRIYSDGYIEQSDAQYIETKSINAVNGTFINLLKPMKSYTYGISVDKINSGPWAQTEFAYAEVYPTGFWLASYTSSIPGSVLVRWIVRGY